MGEPGQGPSVIHGAVGQGQPGRSVVERDVAGEGRLAGEHDWSGVHREDADGTDERPRVDAKAGPRKREPEPHYSESDYERRRKLRACTRYRGEASRNDDNR